MEERVMSHQEQAVAALGAILGPTQVISDARMLEYYKLDGLRPSRGYRDREQLGAQPTCVVCPRSTVDVQALVRWANSHRVPLIPYGGGTGLMGGAMTNGEGVLIDFRDMARILAISQEDQQAVVQPGVK